MNLQHIESRPSKNYKDHYAFFVSCDDSQGGLKEVIEDLRPKVTTLKVFSRSTEGTDSDETGTVVSLSLYTQLNIVYFQ